MKTALCYYCRKNEPDPTHGFKTKLYKKIDSSYGIGLTGLKKTTKFYEKELEVERCNSCYQVHQSANKPILIAFLSSAAVAAVVTGILARRVAMTIGVAIGAGFVGMIAYIFLVYRKRIKALGIKDENSVNDYPPVRQLLDDGWQTYKP